LKLLLLGCEGQVGWELQRSLAALGPLVCLPRAGRDDLCGDLCDGDGIARTMRQVNPDVVVNAAAYTAVDKAESQVELAARINTEAPGMLASLCAQNGSVLVHYSTDYVFDGSGSAAWREDDTTSPINTYGQTKWDGEQAIRAEGCDHLVFRTQWVYATRGNNFMRTMLRLCAERDELQVIDDQHGAPTGAALIADVTAHAIVAARGERDLLGTYHLAAAGQTTWFDYAHWVIAAARSAGWPVRVAQDHILPVPSTAYKTAAIRPANSRLSLDRVQSTFGLTLPDWSVGCLHTLHEILAQELHEARS
jgi:dTDP-4-dehydrorhamnose reductase